MNIFNDSNCETNGEVFFLNTIKKDLNVVFDVGSRDDSIFLDLNCDVHYFEPNPNFILNLKNKKNNNHNSFYNEFGLSNIKDEIEYYVNYQSFLNRNKTINNGSDKIKLIVNRADNYILNNNITNIDFIKIDTEGFELKVLKGFGELLRIVKIIQFEYGGTYIDAGITLKEVIDFLKDNKFNNFSYITNNGTIPIEDTNDHYQYCNIVCFNSQYF
jgi:hypothetical protein